VAPAPVRRRRRRPIWQRLLQALLLLAAGIGLFLALLQVPEQVDLLRLISEVIDELIAGLSLLARALLGLAGILLMLGLLLLSLLLMVSGLVRLVRPLLPRGGSTSRP
jgi:hypothetical protein